MAKYIMIIDDSPTIRISVEFAIRNLGFSLQHAENGIDAMEKVRAIKAKGDEIVMCITDINMPQMDGIGFIKEYRAIDKFSPIIVLTTESEDNKIKEGKLAGASGWIVKPFQPTDLINVVKKFLK
jgi:two-component system chemotaxis response regulator CheY